MTHPYLALRSDGNGQTSRSYTAGSKNPLPSGMGSVNRYICSSGVFTHEDIEARLQSEIRNNEEYHVQYWPVFELSSDALIGCCGLRPRETGVYEIGFHLRPEYWGKGYAAEAANAVIRYAFSDLHAEKLFAGHNPENTASRHVLEKLGFRYIRNEYYGPTGLYHPSYELSPLQTGGYEK